MMHRPLTDVLTRRLAARVSLAMPGYGVEMTAVTATVLTVNAEAVAELVCAVSFVVAGLLLIAKRKAFAGAARKSLDRRNIQTSRVWQSSGMMITLAVLLFMIAGIFAALGSTHLFVQ